jgi:hypothetical protein
MGFEQMGKVYRDFRIVLQHFAFKVNYICDDQELIMKTIFSIITIFLLCSITSFCQVPQGIPYQAVVRDNAGNPLLNQSINVKLSLRDASAVGTVVYEETHATNTNGIGLFSLTFGSGIATLGNFTSINWSSGYKYLQVQTDFGNGYVDIGTQQLMAVPYALYAGVAGSTQVSNPDVMRLGKGISMISENSPSQSYFQSVNYCATLTEGGYSDWRLPNLQEVFDYLSKMDDPLSREYYFKTTTPCDACSATGYFFFIRHSFDSDAQDIQFISSGPFANYFPCTCVR